MNRPITSAMIIATPDPMHLIRFGVLTNRFSRDPSYVTPAGRCRLIRRLFYAITSLPSGVRHFQTPETYLLNEGSYPFVTAVLPVCSNRRPCNHAYDHNDTEHLAESYAPNVA